MKTKDEIQTMYNEALTSGSVCHYKKIGKIIFRQAVPNETIISTCGGKVETLKTLKADEMIIRNVTPGGSAETYAMEIAKFKKRYEPTGQLYNIDGQRWETAVASGEIDAFEYQGEKITFMAPWGEEMLCEYGDMICSAGKNDIYRIAKNEFLGTYEFVSDAAKTPVMV